MSRVIIASLAVWFYFVQGTLAVAAFVRLSPLGSECGWWASFVPLAALVATLARLLALAAPLEPAMAVCAAYFLLALLPVLGFVNIYFMALFAGGGSLAVCGTRGPGSRCRRGVFNAGQNAIPAAGLGNAAAALLLCGILTFRYATLFKSEEGCGRIPSIEIQLAGWRFTIWAMDRNSMTTL